MQRMWMRLCLRGIGVLMAVAILGNENSMNAATDAAVYQVQIVASDMCCKGCAQKVAAELYTAPGVTTVEADVPRRLVTITAKPSPKLTLERLWRAVETAHGKPSKLITTQATYTLAKPEALKSKQPLPRGQFAVEVHELHTQDEARNIANHLYAIGGVQQVRVDVPKATFFFLVVGEERLSVWTIAGALEEAGDSPVRITGADAQLNIERTTDQTSRAAALLSPTSSQRGIQ